MEAFTTLLRRLSRSCAAARRPLPPIVLVAVAGVPLAVGASLVVSTFVAASAPVAFTIDLPDADTRPTWREETERFSRRLEEGFDLAPARADRFAAWILEASARQQLPPELIASLVYTESTFRTGVRSYSGAVGPAQVKPRFWQGFCGGVDLADPEQNVYCGAQILAHYAARCGDVDCAFRLYNVGPSNLRDPYYRERSHVYLAKIEDGRDRLGEVPAQPPAAAAL